jgi:hypothetical protein
MGFSHPPVLQPRVAQPKSGNSGPGYPGQAVVDDQCEVGEQPGGNEHVGDAETVPEAIEGDCRCLGVRPDVP